MFKKSKIGVKETILKGAYIFLSIFPLQKEEGELEGTSFAITFHTLEKLKNH